MKAAILAIAAVLLPLPLVAQQPPEDSRLAIYRQLLSEANDRLTVAIGQARMAEAENVRLKAEIEKHKKLGEQPTKP